MPGKVLFLARRVADPGLSGWLADHAVLVHDGRIEAVVPTADLPSDASTTRETHDLGDVSLLPGFIETHIHMHYRAAPDYREVARLEPTDRLLIRAVGHMRDLLRSGATTARDTGSLDEVALAVRSAIRDGVAPGPRLLVAGAPITTTGGHYWFLGAEADTTDEVIRRVRERRKLGRRPREGHRVRWRVHADVQPPVAPVPARDGPRGRGRGASAGPAGAGPLADRGEQPDLRRGRGRHDHPRRGVVDGHVDPRSRLRLRRGGRGPHRGARHLGRPDDRGGRGPSTARGGRLAGAARRSSTGPCPTSRASSNRGWGSCATWPIAASGSSAGWGWGCRWSPSTRSRRARRSTRGISASTRGGRSRPSPRTRPPPSGWARRWVPSDRGWSPISWRSRATRSRISRALDRVRDVVQGGRVVVRAGVSSV